MPSSEACLEELETLRAIFLDDITIDKSLPNETSLVSMIMFPATGDDEESRFVTLTLEIYLCSNYPKVPPNISFRNPRGLDDLKLEELMKRMKSRCEERLDSQMIYELIDMGREFLTSNNRPATECPICLLSITDLDVFFRTECFHYFHSNCLGNYLKNLLGTQSNKGRKLYCPVCRKKMQKYINVELLVSAPVPSEESKTVDTIAVLQDWKTKRQSMQEIFDKQKAQGGIIDLSVQNNNALMISRTAISNMERRLEIREYRNSLIRTLDQQNQRERDGPSSMVIDSNDPTNSPV